MNSIKSPLKLEVMVFDNIEFTRNGFDNSSKLNVKCDVEIMQNTEGDVFKVSLMLKGERQNEFNFNIKLTGIFSIDPNQGLSKEEIDNLISINTIAIMMPTLRSQLILLTSQPNLEPIILPTLNINNFNIGENTIEID